MYQCIVMIGIQIQIIYFKKLTILIQYWHKITPNDPILMIDESNESYESVVFGIDNKIGRIEFNILDQNVNIYGIYQW